MTKRERVIRALHHQEVDRVPYDQSSRSSAIEREPYDALKQYLGLDSPTTTFLRAHAEMDDVIFQLLGIDTRFIRFMGPEYWSREGADELFIDAWNVPWRRRAGASYFELDGNPFATLGYEEILRRPWKPLVDKQTAAELKKQAEYLYSSTDAALFCDQIGAGLFERAWYLRGFEQFLIDMMIEKPMVHRYMERLLEHQIQGYAAVFDVVGPYITGILLTDDLATQDSLIFSRELYREMIFPYHKRLLEFIRSREIKVIFHSCGAVYPLIGDLLEAGVEILHPIQKSARGMDPLRIKREYGSNLVIWGAGCGTELLQSGSPSEIVDDVHRTIDTLSPGGGFIFTTTHCIQPGTPPENILAMVGALQGFSQNKGDESEWARRMWPDLIQG